MRVKSNSMFVFSSCGAFKTPKCALLSVDGKQSSVLISRAPGFTQWICRRKVPSFLFCTPLCTRQWVRYDQYKLLCARGFINSVNVLVCSVHDIG